MGGRSLVYIAANFTLTAKVRLLKYNSCIRRVISLQSRYAFPTVSFIAGSVVIFSVQLAY